MIQKTTKSSSNNAPKSLQPNPMLANTRPPLLPIPQGTQGRLDQLALTKTGAVPYWQSLYY